MEGSSPEGACLSEDIDGFQTDVQNPGEEAEEADGRQDGVGFQTENLLGHRQTESEGSPHSVSLPEIPVKNTAQIYSDTQDWRSSSDPETKKRSSGTKSIPHCSERGLPPICADSVSSSREDLQGLRLSLLSRSHSEPDSNLEDILSL